MLTTIPNHEPDFTPVATGNGICENYQLCCSLSVPSQVYNENKSHVMEHYVNHATQ